MGVPSFFRWLVDKYPNVVVPAKSPIQERPCSSSDAGLEFDNLYLDMNGIIHPCFHPDDQEPPTTFDEVFQSVFEYIDWLFKIVRPKKLLFMAIDGVAPRAKMNQQRSRRFRTAKDAEIAEAEEDRLRKEFERKGKKLLPKQESEVSDSNVITPGTCFMDKLARALEGYICTRLDNDPQWKNIKVILSDGNAPGEGEHKIMNFIRLQRNLKGYDPNTRHCLYGLDADLIMLALATHEPHFSILREDVLMEEKQPCFVKPGLTSLSEHHSGLLMSSNGDSSKWRPRILAKKFYQKPYHYLNVWTLREYLEIELQIPEPPFEIDFERIVDDFIFICFFSGNDFLPHMPTLDIRENAIDLLMAVYKDEFKSRGGYLVNTEKLKEQKAGYVKLKRIEKFILSVGTYEERIFKKRTDLRQRMINRLYRQMSDDMNEQEIGEEEPVIESCFRDLELNERNTSCKESSSDISSTSDQNDVLMNTKELKKQVKDLMREKQDLFKQGSLDRDKVRLGMQGWKERYYKEKFAAEGSTEIENKRKEIVQKYVEGLCWVLQYYFSGVRSWSWFYPYHHGPFASDLKGLGKVNVSFTRGDPFKPFDQLMGVLPPRSVMALPKVYWHLMTSEESELIYFYPTDFEVDIEGKRQLWQGIVKLPFIDEKRLRCETQKLENELEENEIKRNSRSQEKIFVLSSHGLGRQILLLYKDTASGKSETKIRIPIDAEASGGMNGFISPCGMDLEWSVSTISQKAMPKAAKEHVVYSTYEYPDMHSHIPRLLENVILPEKTVVETDFVNNPLWHEYDGHRPPTNRIQIQCKYRATSADPVSAGENYRSAGSGWGAGRGKRFTDESHRAHHERGRGFAPESPSSLLGTGQRNLSWGTTDMGASRNGTTASRGKMQASHGNCSRSNTGSVETTWVQTSVPLRPMGAAPSGTYMASGRGVWGRGQETTWDQNSVSLRPMGAAPLGTNMASGRWVPGRGQGYLESSTNQIMPTNSGRWVPGRGRGYVESSENHTMPANYYRADSNYTNHLRPMGTGTGSNLASGRWVPGRGRGYVESSGSHTMPTNYYRADTNYTNHLRPMGTDTGSNLASGKRVSGRGGGYVESPQNQPTNFYSSNTANAWTTGQGGNVSSAHWSGPPRGNWVARGGFRPTRNGPNNDNSSHR